MLDSLGIFLQSSTYVSLITLTAMEIVLGIDNVVFIAIVAGRLPEDQREKARKLGLLLALVMRIALLLAITWIIGLTTPWLTFGEFKLSGRDFIMLAGGLFLIYKATKEIHEKIENSAEHSPDGNKKARFWPIIGQIILLDMVFSFDSVITAVGLVNEIIIMVIAVILSLAVMLAFSGAISAFIARHPAVKMLALSFLLMIGTMLVAEGLHFHMPHGYVYFAMAFSLFVEFLNIKAGSRGGSKAH